MKLATIRTWTAGTRAVRVDDDQLVDLGAADVGELLAAAGLARSAPRRPTDPVYAAAAARTSPRSSRAPARSSASG